MPFSVGLDLDSLIYINLMESDLDLDQNLRKSSQHSEESHPALSNTGMTFLLIYCLRANFASVSGVCPHGLS
jgi:hypothetical protein